MKKAKEYAQLILDAKTEDEINLAIRQIANDMVEEIKEVSVARNVQSTKALKAIIKEQNQKWNAICRIVNTKVVLLIEDAFIDFLESVIPDTKIIMRS